MPLLLPLTLIERANPEQHGDGLATSCSATSSEACHRRAACSKALVRGRALVSSLLVSSVSSPSDVSVGNTCKPVHLHIALYARPICVQSSVSEPMGTSRRFASAEANMLRGRRRCQVCSDRQWTSATVSAERVQGGTVKSDICWLLSLALLLSTLHRPAQTL